MRFPTRSGLRAALLSAALAIFMTAYATPGYATSDRYLDVCAAGCTYNDLQTAIDAITDSAVDKVYTVFIDAGVLEVDESVTLGGKSYINIVGRSAGASILRATPEWFANVESASTPGDLLDLSGSTNVIVRGITVDALTSDDGSHSLSVAYNGIRTDDGHKILLDSIEVLATSYAVWEFTNSSSHRIDLTNSRVRSPYLGVYLLSAATWHIFSTDIRGQRTGVNESVTSGGPSGIAITSGADTPDVTIWGCHVHGQTDDASTAGVVSALRTTGAANISIVGSTLHAKLTQNPSGNLGVFALYSSIGGARIHAAGSHLLYETPANLTTGRIAGIGYAGSVPTYEVTLASTDIIDAGGSGGAQRSDIVNAAPIGLTTQPRLRLAAVRSSQNPQKGTVTLASGSAVVTLAPTQANLYYNVILTSAAPETLSVTSRSTTQFTISSSNGASTAVVEYQVVR